MREFVYLAAVAAMATIFIANGAYSMECPDFEPANVTHESDCSKYYKCHMGRKFVFKCEKDNTTGRQLCFVEGQYTCGWWEDCKCIQCKSLEDDHKWPDPENEHGYYQCKNGEVEKKVCANNEVFDPKTLNCQSKGGDTCLPSESGKQYPHECICEKYYECKDGRKIVKNCDDGLLFDADTLTCRPRVDARCNNQPPKCLKDGAYPIETTCYYYYQCVNGVRTTKKCQYGLVFDRVKRVCTKWDQATCDDNDFTTPDPNNCASWERPKRRNPNDCNRYYECVRGVVDDVKCLENHYFHEKIQACDLKKNVNCKNNGKDCPAVDCGKVRYPHDDCEWYYECRNGNKVALKCPSGLDYNKNSEMCDLPANVKCPTPKPVDCEPGKKLPHECQCNMYYTCDKDGDRVVSHCSSWQEFDEVTLNCVPAGQAKCHKEHKNASFNQSVSHWFQ